MDQLALSAGLEQETDADLLVYMTMRKDDAGLARRAWNEFHGRHVEYLYKVCRRYHAVIGGDAGVRDLVQDTFVRVYEKADLFNPEGAKDSDAIRIRVRAWMGQIAANLLRSALRSDRKLPAIKLEQQDWQDVSEGTPDGDGVAADVSKLTLYQWALNGLSTKEREVLRLTGLYWQPGRKNQKLPNGKAEEAAKSLGTTPEGMRQIRKRALAQIAEFIERETSKS